MYLCEHGSLGTRYALGTIFILVIVLASCGGNDSVVLHPTPDNIQEVTDPRFVLHGDPSVEWIDLSTLEGIFVGLEDGAPLEVIGQVWDLDISMNGLFYSDFIYGHVREYDLEGNLTRVVGKRGEGPGEFPRVLFVDVMNTGKDSYLVVGGSEIHVVVFKEDDGAWVLSNTFRTPYSFWDGGLCVMDGHIYTIGHSEEYTGVVHKHTLEGEYVLSFGQPYSDPDPFVRRIISGHGSLDCNEEHSVIAYVHELSSVVTGFSDMGDIRWQVQLADVDPKPARQSINEKGRTGVGMKYGGTSVEHTSEIRFVSGSDPQFFVMTYYSPVPGETRGWEKQHMFSVDAASGYGSYLGWHTLLKDGEKQPYVKAFDAMQVYTSRSSPYPQIGIYRRTDVLP